MGIRAVSQLARGGLFISLILAPAASAQPKYDKALRRSTAAGVEVRIFTYTQHTSNCAAGPLSQITVTGQPAHGRLDFRPDTVVMTQSRTGNNTCVGTRLPGVAVWYVPGPSFRGTDQFDYIVTSRDNEAHDRVTVDVR